MQRKRGERIVMRHEKGEAMRESEEKRKEKKREERRYGSRSILPCQQCKGKWYYNVYYQVAEEEKLTLFLSSPLPSLAVSLSWDTTSEGMVHAHVLEPHNPPNDIEQTICI